MTCYRNVFHHHLSWLEEFQIDSRYFLLKTLSLFCDHCFGLELPLSILKHNLLQLICTRNQMMEERALSQSRERLERDALPKWASPLVCSPGSDWAPVFTSSTDDFGLFLWASWLLCWCPRSWFCPWRRLIAPSGCAYTVSMLCVCLPVLLKILVLPSGHQLLKPRIYFVGLLLDSLSCWADLASTRQIPKP